MLKHFHSILPAVAVQYLWFKVAIIILYPNCSSGNLTIVKYLQNLSTSYLSYISNLFSSPFKQSYLKQKKENIRYANKETCQLPVKYLNNCGQVKFILVYYVK